MTRQEIRCAWSETNSLMRDYHDTEWGRPEKDSRTLWETLMLEGFQAGLSWEIILRKREAFREAFAMFDPLLVSQFDQEDVARLMDNAGIVRSRAKIEATIKGAQIFCNMQSSGEDFADYCWSFTEGRALQCNEGPLAREISEKISKDLKRRGFKFVGPTIVYAWMQAIGIINDHTDACFRQSEIQQLAVNK